MNYLQYFKDLEMRRAGVLHCSDLKASAVCAGWEDTTALPNAGEQNPWDPFASTSCSMCPELPRCFKCSHPPSDHGISPLCCNRPALLFQPSHHNWWEPRAGAGSYLSHRQRSPARMLHAPCIAHTLIASCPGTAVLQTEPSCQKRTGPRQVWHLYASQEHVGITGIHTINNATNCSWFSRRRDKVWTLCSKKLQMPPWASPWDKG